MQNATLPGTLISVTAFPVTIALKPASVIHEKLPRGKLCEATATDTSLVAGKVRHRLPSGKTVNSKLYEIKVLGPLIRSIVNGIGPNIYGFDVDVCCVKPGAHFLIIPASNALDQEHALGIFDVDHHHRRRVKILEPAYRAAFARAVGIAINPQPNEAQKSHKSAPENNGRERLERTGAGRRDCHGGVDWPARAEFRKDWSLCQ